MMRQALPGNIFPHFGIEALGVTLASPALVEVRWLGVAVWQWLALATLVVVAHLASWIAVAILLRAAHRLAGRWVGGLDEQLIVSIRRPLRFTVAIAAFVMGALLLDLPPVARRNLSALATVAVVVAVAWLLMKVVDALAEWARARLTDRGRTTALATLPLGSKVAKVGVFVFALLAILENIGVNVTGVVAGLGIGGLAVALAAQKTVENLFGGVSLMIDQPVRVGDFCRFGERLGTIEDIGLRSTRVRTLDRTVVAVPNAQFVAQPIENFALRDRIWLTATLGLRYETTPAQLRWILVEIRKLLYTHPKVDPDPARVRVVGFGACSIDLELFAYVRTGDYGEFLAIREELYLQLIDIMAASGTSFAFPSQTTYIASDEGLDEDKRRAVERMTRTWADRGERYFPDFPPEVVAALQADGGRARTS